MFGKEKTMEYIKIILICSVLNTLIKAEASSHWMVTEKGLIEPKLLSPFNMERPNDLLSLLAQEKRWSTVFELYYDLIARQVQVNKLWEDLERETDIESHLAHNKHCIQAGNLNSFDWFISFLDEESLTNIPETKILFTLPQPTAFYDVPDCKKMSSLIFSMAAFEHLEGIRRRNHLTVSSDQNLIKSPQTVDMFGHWLHSVLKENISSWMHYDMAVIYWRLKGNAPKALECSRRAVHYVPREHKDLALLNMGTILHQSKMTEDAIIVLNAAIDHNRDSYLGHFTIGNAYAVTGNYNMSLHHFNESLRVNPQPDTKFKYIDSVLCHMSLVPRIEAIKKTLEILRKELIEYSRIETPWPVLHREFLKTMKQSEDFDIRNTPKLYELMSEVMDADVKVLKKYGDKYYLMNYFLDDPVYCGKWEKSQGVFGVDAVTSLQRLIKHIEINVNMSPQNIIKIDRLNVKDEPKHCTDKDRTGSTCNLSAKPQNEADKDISEYEVGVFMYPSTMKVNRNSEDFDTENDWPTDDFCKDAAANFPENIEAIYPVFLPFENKGIRIGTLLTDKIGVPLWEEHELPWHPPTCAQEKDALAYTQKKIYKPPMLAEVIDNGYLRKKLLEYVSNDNVALAKNMQDVEIGQRIYTAKKKKLAPKWMLLVLSSLYWRVRGNKPNALHCLFAANKIVKPRYKDIVLTSLASVYLEMGYLDEAITAAEEAIRLGIYEPSTNFVLSEINMITKYRSPQMFHLKQVVRVAPMYLGGLARNLHNAWACVIKQVNAFHEVEMKESDVCTQVEPGVTVVCEKDSDSCFVANIRCRKRHADVKSLLRMLDGSNDIREPGFINDNFFDWVLSRAPADRTDKDGHREHMGDMMLIISRLKGCGPKGCQILRAEDLSLKEDDCSFLRVQFGYWIQNVKEMIMETDTGIIKEISGVQPVLPKKIPDCRTRKNAQDDFFLERLNRLDVNGWEPLMTVAHQFADLFNIYDYSTLGSKIARFVENRSNSWLGAMFASWWCGVVGHGGCALRCASAAHALAPPARAHVALRVLVVLLHLQSKMHDAKDIAYLAFYTAPKSKTEAFLAAVSHTHLKEYEQAIWMYRYALKLDEEYLAAKACLHGTICLMLYGTDKNKYH